MGRSKSGDRKRVVLATTLAITVAGSMSVAAQAQERMAPQSSVATRLFRFDIAAQPLPQALNEIGRTTGLAVIFTGSQPFNVTGRPVQGNLTPSQALAALLAGTGVTYRFTNPRTVTIDTGEQSGSVRGGSLPAGAISLDTIDVQGAGNPNSTMSLPPAYAGGQIARGGQLGMLGNRDMMDTPFNQTVYTRKLIENQQARILGDVLNNDPSVVKVFDSGGGFPRDQWFVRGVGANAQSVAFGGLFGIAQTQSGSMATEGIERVEVLKGASALLNGLPPSQLASLGTVNLVPKRAGDEPLIAFTPDYAMNSQAGGHLDVGQRFGDNKEFGIRFNGVYRSGDTPILNNSRETRVTAFGFDYRGETVRLSLDLGYQNQIMRGVREIIYLDSGVPIPRPPRNTANWGQPWQSYNSEHKYATTRGEWDINDSVTAYAAVGRSTIGVKTVENYMSVTDAAGTLLSAWYPSASIQYIQAATAEAGLRGRAEIGPVSHALALAAGWANEESGFEQNAGTPLPASNLYNPVYFPQPDFAPLGDPRHVPKNNRNENLGFALADTLSILNERVQLMLGIRHQNVKQMSFSTGASYDASALSPAAALIVKPWENVSLYANYMEALQAGAIAPRTSLNAGEVFTPYKTTQYEVGAKVDFGRIAMTLAAFTATRPTFALDPDTFIFGEVGKTRFQGIEMTAFGQATETIRFVGGVTLMDATLVETPDGINVGNRYGGIPKYRATLSMEWDTPFVDDLTLVAMGQYQSSTYFDDENIRKIGGWYRFDLNARYTIRQPGWKPIIVRATLRNVLDQSYWATTGYQLGLNEPRTFLLSTTFQF
ncbi:TonB-dependent receptor [Nitrobacter winogradskyi]|uniref:TonB dependent/Ligand-Gated channel TonB n=2 Tax=Nitrobacter winogradskyi TaxID=913 RepID=A0A4Y3WEP1_NITWI|nr:TonB-dependent receptor [Nitrobacter winogradskyi]MCP1999807.1 iron complex outermembrane receptor protein [Nitrobacter winogradskyi]GEC17487.1 TonB dependent/Ligand-Gated channel TonB [Nitrobacter winogradskyi]